MTQSEKEFQKMIISAVGFARNELGWSDGKIAVKILEAYGASSVLYTPNKSLKNKLEEYKNWCKNGSSPDVAAGQMMEQLALLAFKCLMGFDSLKSYSSYSHQHDLVISGTGSTWAALIEFLGIRANSRTIVVEAKIIDKPIDVNQFSRLCAILQNNFDTSCCLGIFFTRNGATGFPMQNSARKRCLQYARALQMLFHAKTGKFIIVLSHEDILKLEEEGALLRIIQKKIREVEEATGLSKFDQIVEDWGNVDTDLPPHLSMLLEEPDA